ncbi:Zizimin [Trichostrongylus colubriformis]|uniref:Zizimin n=1 Tax=Trichostrongylus colubriformis TaxID=6319 RepID=A0AAN8F9M2_TRICO
MRSLMSGRASVDDRRSDISGTSAASTLIRDTSTTGSRSGAFPLRKFTAGVGRPGQAREAREAVRSVVSAHSTSRRVTPVEPLDYEKFVIEKAILLENDPQRELLMFPRDDAEEVVQPSESKTVQPMITQKDIVDTTWLLTRDALKSFVSPKRSISFNYAKFAGDYDCVNDETAENDEMLSSLLIESDMISEEERAAMENASVSDVIREGFVMVLSETGLLDNFKSAKRRYCTVKQQSTGEVSVDIRKTRDTPPKRPQMIVQSAQLRSMRKGRTVLEIKPLRTSKERAEVRSLTLAFEEDEDLSDWFLALQRAISSVARGDTLSLGSHQDDSISKAANEPDSSSIGSADSGRDSQIWRGQRAVAKALQPPIVDRKNIFSLFSNLSPSPKPVCQPLSVLCCGSTSHSSTRRHSQISIISFLIEFKKLDLRLDVAPGVLQQIEPFYLTFFVYDVSQGRRVSEVFQLDCSSEKTNEVVDAKSDGDLTNTFGVSRAQLTSRAASQMLFTTCSSPKDLWVVCYIDRMLSLDYSGDLYMKSTGDVKATAKLHKLLQTSWTRLSKYRQRFAWAARPLLEENLAREALSPRFNTGFSTMQLFRCDNNRLTDQDLQKYLSDFAKVEKAGKSIVPNSSVAIKIEVPESKEEFESRVNPSFYALKPWKLSNDSPVPPVFELQTFGDPVVEPYSELFNLLYIYPISLKYDSQRVFPKARNILCTVRLVRGADHSAAKVFFDRLHPSGPLVASAKCAVQYHQQFPHFGDEMKARLPLCLNASDHLLFSFSHVSVGGQANSKDNETVETPIGFAWLPLIWKKDRLVMENDDQEYALPVAADLPDIYFRNRPFRGGKVDESADIKWVDQRALFRFRMRLVSSVFTTDPILQDFFQACDQLDNLGCTGSDVDLSKTKTSTSISRSTSSDAVRSCSPLVRTAFLDDEHPLVKTLLECTNALVTVEITKVIPFLNVILSRLLTSLTLVPTENLAMATLSALVSICDRCEGAGHKHLLRAYVRYHFVTLESGEGPTHSVICRFLQSLTVSLQENVTELAALYRQLWFLFDVIAKGIAQLIVRRSLLKCPRKDRLSPEVLDQIGSLITTIVPLLISKHREHQLPKECRAGITCIAFFLRCCLSFVDRGAVFKWINFILQRLDECDSKVIRDFKLDVLSILSQHEHWLPLCLPVVIDSQNQIHRVISQPLSSDYSVLSGPGSRFLPRFLNMVFQPAATSVDKHRYASCSEEWYLNETYISHHFPSGIIFQELYACMREPREYRRRALVLLRNLLAKHSFDKRYLDMNIQRRIAVLYLPFLRFAMDHISELEDAMVNDTGETTTYCANASVSDAQPARSFGACSTVFAQRSTSPTFALCGRLDQEEVQNILVSVLYVIHRVPKRILGALCIDMKQDCVLQLLRLLEITLHVFRYRGRPESKASIEKPVPGPLLHKQMLAVSSQDYIADCSRGDGSGSSSISMPYRALQHLNLSQEVALIVLEVAQILSQEFADRYVKSHVLEECVFSKLFSIYLSLLDDRWPEGVRLHAIAALSVFVNMFHTYLFEEGPLDDLSLLIERLLVVMASRLSAVQNAAAALLHLVLRYGYETSQAYLAGQAMAQSVSTSKLQSMNKTSVERLGRPGCQTSVALARLLGTKSTISSARLEKGLCVLYNLANAIDGKRIASFGQAVMELVHQLRGVMSATVALKDAANDPIRLADLHIQLADSYRGSAALRSAWFDALAELHTAENWHAEAAVCHAHSLAIIAKELAAKGLCKIDWTAFDWISSSVVKDEGVAELDGTVQSAGFTPDSLANKIEQTASALTLAERYEAIGPMYRLIIPIFEKSDNFKSLVGIYAELQQTYSRAAEVKASGKRHLGSYFRVRFFGEYHSRFEHGTDWVYREAGLASLAEVSLRLREYHRQLIGHDRIQVEPGSEVDTSLLNPSIAYIWVNHVEPVLAEGQTSKHFKTHTNISEFTYESPVSESSENEGKEPSLTNQALKKTVLKVEGAFPSSRRRLPVVSASSNVISPLEFACQKLESKANQINGVLDDVNEARPLDVKGLQLLLQGAVMPTVNVGPLAYAEAFTQPEQKERYGENGIHDLEGAFRKLMSACERGLQVNETVVAMDQQTYHEVLLASFDAMHERLHGFFGVSLRDVRRQETVGADLPKSAIHVLDTIGGVIA